MAQKWSHDSEDQSSPRADRTRWCGGLIFPAVSCSQEESARCADPVALSPTGSVPPASCHSPPHTPNLLKSGYAVSDAQGYDGKMLPSPPLEHALFGI